MNRQPNFRTRVVKSALSEGLILAAYPFGGSYVDVVGGAVAAQTNFVAFADPRNVAFSNGGTCRAGESVLAPLNANNSASGWTFAAGATGLDFLFSRGTVMALGGCTGSAGAYHCMVASQETFNGTVLGLLIDDNAFWGQGNVMLRIGASGIDTNHTSGALTSDPKGKLHFFGAGFDGTTGYYYSQGNGLVRESVAYAASPTAGGDTTRLTTIGRATSAVFQTGYQNYVALALGWNRVLSLAEYALLWQNPWQLFQQVERRVYSIPAAVTAYPHYYYAQQRMQG